MRRYIENAAGKTAASTPAIFQQIGSDGTRAKWNLAEAAATWDLIQLCGSGQFAAGIPAGGVAEFMAMRIQKALCPLG